VQISDHAWARGNPGYSRVATTYSHGPSVGHPHAVRFAPTPSTRIRIDAAGHSYLKWALLLLWLVALSNAISSSDGGGDGGASFCTSGEKAASAAAPSPSARSLRPDLRPKFPFRREAESRWNDDAHFANASFVAERGVRFMDMPAQTSDKVVRSPSGELSIPSKRREAQACVSSREDVWTTCV
jgi:hypothetical protein